MRRFLLLLALLVPCLVKAQSDPLNSAYKPSVNTSCPNTTANGTGSNIWITDVMQKVLQTNSTPGTNCFLQVNVTQGEFADFQIHVVAPGGGYSALSVTSSSFVCNTGPGTAGTCSAGSPFTIPAPSASSNNIVVHREAYHAISTVTNHSASYYNATGSYPDALIPAIDPYFHQNTNAFPIAVAASKTQSAWIDIFVPQNAPSGYYLGTITVSDSTAGTLAQIPVIMAVWQWPSAQGSHMPSTSSLRSDTQSGFHDFCAFEAYGAQGNNANCGNYPPAAGNVGNGEIIGQLAGTVMFLDHRLSLNEGNLTPTNYAPWLSGSNNYAFFNTIIPSATMTNVKWSQIGTLQTFQTQMQAYPNIIGDDVVCDEPSAATVTSSCNPACTTAHATTPPTRCRYPVAYGPFCALATPVAPNNNCNTGAGGENYADTWVVEQSQQLLSPLGNNGNPAVNLLPVSNTWLFGSGSISGLPRTLWSYVSCASGGTCGNGAPGDTDFSYPSDNIDQKPAGNRAQEWFIFQSGEAGELSFNATCMWTSIASGGNCPQGQTTTTDPWTSVYLFGNNGDGTIVYASTFGGTVHHVTQPNGSPLVTEIWIPSIRLKLKRDGLQDYEYLKALTTAGQGSFVTTQMNNWMTTLANYETTGTGLQTARTNIGNTLHQVTFPASSFPASGCAIQGSGPNWSCAAGALFSDMQTAVNNMADGAQLILQNGSYTITSPVSFLLTKGITLICTTTPLAIGAATVNPCNVNVTSPSYGFGVASWPGSGQYFDKLYRISGITFTWSDPPASTVPIEWGSQNAAVNEGTFKYLRFDHNTFTSTYTGTTKDTIKLLATGHRTYFYGAIDHNLETCTDSCHLLLISSAQQDPFVPPNPLGTPNNLFVEDNTVTVTTENNPGEGAFDSDYGLSSVVWRHNTITNDDVTSHFPMINYELYNNLFIKNGGSPNPDCYRAFHSQTNSLSEAFNNQAQCTGTVTSGTVVYSFGSIREAYKADPRTWPTTLECSGFVNHPPFTDINRLPSQTNQGYPCLWQPTRDPATMALTPYYVWNNIANGVFKSATFGDSFCGQNPNYCPNHIQNNRDIYQALTATPQSSVASCIDGAGVWFGPLADRPINCPAYTGEVGGGFGYAAHTTSGTIGSSGSGTASDDVLYQFGSGGWKQIYKPYVYPHPLVSGQAQAAAPVFSVAPGPYTSTQNVQVTTTSPSPTLYCTTDRSAPTHPATGTTQTFTGATYPPTFTVSADTEINCLASSGTLLDSLTLSGGYNINATAYNAWPTQPGTYPAGTLPVQINNPAQLVRNCISTNGVDPTESSPGTCSASNVCTGCTLNGVNQFSTVSLTTTGTNTIKFITTGVGFTHSPVTTVQYVLGGTNGLWWEDVGSSNFSIGGVASAENFGTQAVGVPSGTLPIYLTAPCYTAPPYTGPCTATSTSITNVVVAGTGFSRVAGDGCAGNSFTLTPTPSGVIPGNCSLLIQFTPPSNGTFNGTVTISDNTVTGTHVINLTGTGVGGGGQASTPVASPASGAAPLSVTLTTSLGSVICYNTTGAPATNGSTGCNTGTLYTGPISVTVGETLFFVAGGTGLTDSAVGSATYSNPPPQANLTPTTLAFGNQNITTTSAVQNATLTNTGVVTVSVSNVVVAGNFSRATPTTGTPCVGTSFTLAVGANCTIGVTFSPTATIAYNGTLTVNDNSTTSPHVTNLTGQGTQATITWTPTTYNFGNVVLGQSLNSTSLQLKNSGTGPLNVSLTLTDTLHFSIFSNSCPGILAASSTCNVVIQFTPAAVTSYSANLTQTDALASNSPQNVTLSGAGVITPTTPSAPLPVLINP